MKFIVSVLLTALLSFVMCLYMPWWSIAIAAFVVAVCIHQSPVKSFLTGFIALLVLWSSLASFIDIKNEHLLSRKIAAIFPLGGSAFVLIMVTALLGALVAGFASATGSYLREKK